MGIELPYFPLDMGTSPATSILDTALFREFRTAFQLATGLTVDIGASSGFRIPEGAPRFCHMMDLSDSSCEICRETHAVMQSAATDTAHTMECFAGMTSTTIPVKVRGVTVGFLQAGHVFLGKKSTMHFEKLRRFGRRHGLDPDAIIRALQSTTTTDSSRYAAAVQLVRVFARQIPDFLSIAPVSYPAVERALRMIREDLEKSWTLTGVARAVNMNPSYFSDVFHKTTGVTFSTHLANLRVDKACKMLEATSLRISEIAYACGFRSISQFNRRFKQSIGRSPREVRLAGAS